MESGLLYVQTDLIPVLLFSQNFAFVLTPQSLLGFPMANGNLAIITVFATFLPTLIHSKSRSKSNDKFTAVYAVYRKRQTYRKFSAVNGKQKIHTYIWWVYANNVWKKNYRLFTVSVNFSITVETLVSTITISLVWLSSLWA